MEMKVLLYIGHESLGKRHLLNAQKHRGTHSSSTHSMEPDTLLCGRQSYLENCLLGLQSPLLSGPKEHEPS